MNTHTSSTSAPDRESGFALVGYLAVLIPLMGLVGAVMMSMGARSKRLQGEVALEKALLAAQSGIDEAGYRGNADNLLDGVTFSRTLPNKASYFVEPTHLLTGSDGLDNDGDALVDEADEDVFEIVVTGTYATSTRRVAVYLSRTSATIPEAALYTEDPDWNPVLPGTSFISGIDKNLDGTPGPAPAVHGIAVGPGVDTTTINGNLSPSEKPKVTGSSGPPSVGNTSEPFDVEGLANEMWNSSPQIGLGGFLGDAASGDYRIVYGKGELELESNKSGAGILVLDADELELEATLKWDGIVIILGGDELEAEGGNLEVNGTVLMGPDSWEELEFEDGSAMQIQYSSQIVDAVISTLLTGNRYVVRGGWQEISAH